MESSSTIKRIFRHYDIRGIAGSELTRQTAFLLGKAFSAYLFTLNPQATQVSVGRDVRLSSEELAQGVIEGITSTGIAVCDLGVCPTPLQYFSLFHLDLDGGIMVTGSHNPPEYNGFKVSIGKEVIHGSALQRLRHIMDQEEWAEPAQKGNVTAYPIIDAYRSYVLERFSSLNTPQYRAVKVVVDAGNGTAGLVAPDILKEIGCEVIPLYCEPDGRFPHHHPDPTVVEYIQDLITEVKRTGADIGVGYDGDADRIGVVDKEGRIIWGDHILIVLARDILSHIQGIKVIGDVKCSQVMFDAVQRSGGIPLMWKTGHSLIKQKMKEEGALLAGEFSGHIFIKDRYFGYDDALYATVRLVEIMKQTGLDIAALLSDIPQLVYTPEVRLPCPDDKKQQVIEAITSSISHIRSNGNSPCRVVELNTLDGVRVTFEEGWGLIRASNTQPVMVMRTEARSEEGLMHYRTFLESEFAKAMETTG